VRIKSDSVETEEKAEQMRRIFEEEKDRLKATKKIEPREVEERRLGSSEEEDAIIRGVIVAGGNSQKAKMKKNKGKWKAKKPGMDEEEEGIENEDMDGIKRNWTRAEWEHYADLRGATIEMMSDYGEW